MTSAVNAEYGYDSASDFTGEAFFAPPSIKQPSNTFYEVGKEESFGDSERTIPPMKQIRLKLQEKLNSREQKRFELAPTASDIYAGEVETSDYASKEVEDDFVDMNPDGFEADEQAVVENEKNKKSWFGKKDKTQPLHEDTESVVLDCEKVDYDTENYLVKAVGNVNVEFVKQKIVVKADIITFDRVNNTLKAEGNVRIVKSGRVITGDYIFVDLNEENALIENPVSRTANVEIKSKKGYVYGDRIVQEDGKMEIKDSFPIDFRSGKRGPNLRAMLIPPNETLTEDMNNGIVTFQAEEIKITQDGEHEIVTLKKPRLFKGDKRVFKTPSITVYTNKNHDYYEHDHWEIGSIRGLGLFVGPGMVAKLPKGSVFKLIPMLNYKSGFGVGAVGRFNSGTNNTTLAYGTSMEKFLVFGRQELDDNLFLQYATNAYMEEWFLGRRRPKYGVGLVYDKTYPAVGFLLKDKQSSFRHRFEGGYYHDLDFDGKFEKIDGFHIGTTRFRYMAEARQNFFEYVNEEELKALRFDISAQLSSALYGTGDTQNIGRLGPVLHTQYKRWMQDVGFFFSVYDDNTPLARFDGYRYGKQSLYLREYFRICRWLTLSWFGNMNLSNDSLNGKFLQENGFYVSFGPEDIRFNVGYDFIRQNMRCTIDVMMDAKGTKVEYDKFEITQANKSKKEQNKKSKPVSASSKTAPVRPVVLDRAVVENVKEYEDVL